MGCGLSIQSTPFFHNDEEAMSRQAERDRFEAWFKIAYPIFREDKDTTLKHRLWTAWQVAAAGSPPHEAEQAFHRPTWKAALTLAHNLCAQYSNRHNDNDETEQADALNEMCGHIKPYLDCTDEEIAEMVAEANPSSYVNSSDSSGDPQR